MPWYKFWKKSGPAGLLSEYLLWIDTSAEKDVKTRCEEWAEEMPGGHNTHYEYGYQKIKHVPASVLKQKIAQTMQNIAELKNQIVLNERRLEFLEAELDKAISKNRRKSSFRHRPPKKKLLKTLRDKDKNDLAPGLDPDEPERKW